MEGETSDIVLFFGRFHPLILHLPIGFLTLAFLLEVCSRFKRFGHYKPAIGVILFLGAASAIVAAVLGLMLAESGGYNDTLLSIHQWSGLGVAILAVVAFGLHGKLKRQSSPALDKTYMAVMSFMILSLSVAGHYGGSLTHGSDYLTKYMPDGLRKIAGLAPREKKEVKKITNLNEAVVYADIIFPILDSHCTSCHNDDKRKGGLMMHTPEVLKRGGETGPLFVAGSASESQLIQKIQLPEDHDDHMPPHGKPQLSWDQVELLVWWVNQGADFDKRVAEVNVPGEVQSILNTLVDPNINRSVAEILLRSAVDPVNREILQQLRYHGIQISTLSDSIQWLQAAVQESQPGDSIVQALTGVAEQLTWLDLRASSISDSSLSVINSFRNLTRLDLGRTLITDEGLKYLQELPHLESLNIYGTAVTDAGIQHLANLKNLRRLYVWKTTVTEQGVSQLQESLPALEVILGLAGQ